MGSYFDGINTEDNTEKLIATAARVFAQYGDAREVAILANSKGLLTYYEEDWGEDFWGLHLQIPYWLYARISDDENDIQQKILPVIEKILMPYSDHVRRVFISPMPEGVTNGEKRRRLG